MKTIRLDLRDIDSPEVLHSVLKARLALPDYYGRNLDALNDCLGEISEPAKIVALINAGGASRCVSGAIKVLKDASTRCSALSVEVCEL